MGTARWIVHSSATFEARHALATYKGEAEERHNHRWQIEVRVGTEELNSEGYALDFHDVHGILFDAVATLDGTELNDHPTIGDPSPTAEHLAEVLAEILESKFDRIGGKLLSVSVWEGPENRVDLNLDA